MAGLLKLANLQFKELRSEVAGSLLAATAAIVSSSLFFGSAQIWPQWFQGISVIAKEPYATKYGNYAPVNVLGEQTGMASEIFLTLFAVILIASLVWAFLPSLRSFGRRIDAGESREGEGAWKERAQPDSAYAETVLMAGIGMLIYLLTAPLVWLHYYLLTTPLLLFMFRSESTRSVRLLALIATLFIGLSPIMKMFSVYDPVSLANMVICGLFLLTALSIRELRELRSGRAAPPLGSGSAKSGASLDSGA
jgi:hypothetical protein